MYRVRKKVELTLLVRKLEYDLLVETDESRAVLLFNRISGIKKELIEIGIL